MRLRRPRRPADVERSTPRPPLTRSIRTRLAVTFFLVTALSVAVIYVVVAPPLTSGLRNQEVAGPIDDGCGETKRKCCMATDNATGEYGAFAAEDLRDHDDHDYEDHNGDHDGDGE